MLYRVDKPLLMVRRESLLRLVKALDMIHVGAGSKVDNIFIIGNVLDMLRIDLSISLFLYDFWTGSRDWH